MTPPAPGTAPLESGSSPDSQNTIKLLFQNIDYRTIVIMARPHHTLGEVLGHLVDVARRSHLHAVHEGRQLRPEATIGELCLPPDATLHLTPYPDAWCLASQIAGAATTHRLISAETTEFFRNFECNGRFRLVQLAWHIGLPRSTPPDVAITQAVMMLVSRDTVLLVKKFLDRASNVHQRQAPYRAEMMGEYLDVLLRSGVIGLLVRLYLSNYTQHRYRGKSAILSILNPDGSFPIPLHLEVWLVPVYLEFCRLIASGSTHGKSDPLYRDCRMKLSKVFSLECVPSLPSPELPREWLIEQVTRFAQETANEIILDMAKGLVCSVFEFRVFFSVLCQNVSVPCADSSPDSLAGAALSEMAMSLLTSVSGFMASLDLSDRDSMSSSEHQQDAVVDRIWVMLGALDSWSEKYVQFAAAMQAMLMAHAAYLNALVLGTSAGRSRQEDVARVITKNRDLLGAEARRHFSMALLPELEADLPPLDPDMELPLEMVIDRSRLLSGSFRYVSEAGRGKLHAGLDVEFVNEEAIGDGVTREWISLVCRALFDPQHGLFSPCPHNRRRFFLNAAASGADPLHLKYCDFAGRMIGLALTHNVQVGILLDRTLFSWLAGRPITLDDIADADPTMYTSCKKILEMDPDLVDSDVLGLTFAREVIVFGYPEVMELLPGGRDVTVDSKNRGQYIDLLIQDVYVNSTRDQLNHFAEGFSFMLVRPDFRRAFFHTLDLEDLDKMLGGRMSAIDVQEWKENTTYLGGYSEQDDQINWFWKAVASMTAEEQRRLLFFWTSVEYLPFNGFGGLELGGSMRISKASSKTPDHLPSSCTCIYRLNLPCYTSFDMTLSRLCMITQEHVSNGFGEI